MFACLKPILIQLWHSHKLALRSGAGVACAALLTFIFYQHYDIQFGYWGVVTVAAVMQRSLLLTLIKARSRLVGTTLGVAWSMIIISILRYWPEAVGLWFFCGFFVPSLLIFAKPTWSYASVVMAITFTFIVSVYHVDPKLWYAVSIFRSVDIVIGAVLICLCFRLFFISERLQFFHEKTTDVPVVWHFKAALLMASGTTISLSPWFFWHYEGGVWAPIACLFIIEESFDKTMKKSWLRLFAHIVVVCLAGGLSFFCGTTLGTAIVLVCTMFFFGYWLEKPLWGFDSGLANTMGIAFCVILLSDPGREGVLTTLVARMSTTLLGIACGIAIVKIIQHYVPRVVKPLQAHLHNNH